MKHIHHIHIFILIGVILLISLLIFINVEQEKFSLSQNTTFGVSFIPKYAESLGLDPKKTYHSILTDLNIKNLRLSAYWDQIEPFDSAQGKPFYFDDLDWYIEEAAQQNAEIILAIGYKLPRWPECRAPEWVENENLRERQLIMLENVINHYENSPTITAFQIENEPLLPFGECPPPDRNFLKKEVAFVRNLTDKPIIITDSGELRSWVTPMKLSDIFGTTIYRVVDTPWIGPFQYPFRPWVYRVKSDLIRKLFAHNNQKTIISELQAEPWGGKDQIDLFSIDRFKETVEFGKKTGFSEVYLWGVEWWYYLAINGHPEYLEFARSLF